MLYFGYLDISNKYKFFHYIFNLSLFLKSLKGKFEENVSNIQGILDN